MDEKLIESLLSYGILGGFLAGLLTIAFMIIRRMLPHWVESSKATTELKKAVPELAEDMRKMTENQTEMQRGLAVWTESHKADRKETHAKLDAIHQKFSSGGTG